MQLPTIAIIFANFISLDRDGAPLGLYPPPHPLDNVFKKFSVCHLACGMFILLCIIEFFLKELNAFLTKF